jgi:nitrite reductase/ring-hydroxylating ferredoxin subunit
MGFTKVASMNDLKPGRMKGIEVEQKKICLANVNGNFYAIGNRCTHANCSLSDGTLNGPNIKCPCHSSIFNVQTGAIVKGPAKEPEPIYKVKLENGQILISV